VATAAQRLGDFVAQLMIEQIPEPVRQSAKLHVLDALGCGLAAHALGEASYAGAAVREAGSSGPATMIGDPAPLPATDAAFVNGTLCHALDFDDTHPNSVVHVSAGVVPAAMAAAQVHGAPGSDILAATVAGNETAVRIGNAGSGLFHARGFHPTGVCGVFGATAAAARVRELDGVTTAHALGIAGSMASGLMEFLADGADTKRLHPGWAAQAGVTAARLAAHGATGPTSVIDGARGLLAAYLHGDETDIATQIASLGEHWVTPEIAYKPYPACPYTHAPVDALVQILEANLVRAEDIVGITAYTDATGASLVCAPPEDKVRPRTPYDAKFSLPYCLAYRLVHGRLDVTSFTPDAIADERVLALTPEIRYEVRQYAPTPDAFGGGVRLSTTDGRIHEAELRYQRGGSENPLLDADVMAKYRSDARLALGADEAAALESAVLALEDEPHAGFLTVLGRARRRHG
jgi:2-methylcitrate dehydratase PrpD